MCHYFLTWEIKKIAIRVDTIKSFDFALFFGGTFTYGPLKPFNRPGEEGQQCPPLVWG